jgi:hypothetical protein
MPMLPYPILCCCQAPAEFKVAAAWSDGITRELKTYAITCRTCLMKSLSEARAKAKLCRLLPGEVLGVPGVYELARPTENRLLRRREDLE